MMPFVVTGGSAVRILPFVEIGEVAVLERTPPRFVVAIPRDRFPKALVEWDLRLPAQRVDFRAGDRVAAVVSFAVGDVPHVRAHGTPARFHEHPGNLDVRARVAA